MRSREPRARACQLKYIQFLRTPPFSTSTFAARLQRYLSKAVANRRWDRRFRGLQALSGVCRFDALRGRPSRGPAVVSLACLNRQHVRPDDAHTRELPQTAQDCRTMNQSSAANGASEGGASGSKSPDPSNDVESVMKNAIETALRDAGLSRAVRRLQLDGNALRTEALQRLDSVSPRDAEVFRRIAASERNGSRERVPPIELMGWPQIWSSAAQAALRAGAFPRSFWVRAIGAVALALALVLVAFRLNLPVLARWASIGVLVVAASGVVAATGTRIRAQIRRWERAVSQDAELAQLREYAALGVVSPLVRELLNEQVHEMYLLEFAVTDTSGLADLAAAEYEVPTSAAESLKEVLSGLRAGTVAIFGPRGAGKTTLVRAAAESRLRGWDVDNPMGVVVPAPVRYQARDFVSYLFAQLCSEVLGDYPDRLARETRQSDVRARYLIALSWALGAGAIAAGGFATVLPHAAPDLSVVAVALAFAAAEMVAISLFLRARSSPRMSRGTQAFDVARRHLQALHYAETRSEDRSYEWALRGGKVSRTEGRSLAARTAPLPELIARYKQFLGVLHHEGRTVVIGIDELDKMVAEDAALFLNDVKALLGQQAGVYYLVSLSEEAAAAFEQRGVTARDVFDSAFDQVLRVAPLTLNEAEGLLRRRVVGMPLPFQALCFVMSGGLPRELIRCARDVTAAAAAGDGEIDSVVMTAMTRRFRERIRAAETVASRYVASDGTQPVLAWLRALSAESGTSAFERALAVAEVWEARPSNRDAEAIVGKLLAGVASWAFHARTIIEYFGQLDHAGFMCHRGASSRGAGGELAVLADALVDLAVSPALCWEGTNQFRVATGRGARPYPLAAASV